MHHLTKKLTALALFAALALFPATKLLADSLDSTAAPTDPASAMFTLEDIYNRLNTNTQATKRAGGFTEPDAGPASTGRTLDEVYEKAIPTQVPKTGQTATYDTRDDGVLKQGVAWPDPRFTDNDDGTVTDNLTNLVWLKDADCFGVRNWTTALADANGLANGQCDLTDGSVAGDWWLPNSRELFSLIDKSRHDPALPSGHPFTKVQHLFNYYWSSTTYAGFTDDAFVVGMYEGYVGNEGKADANHVWPVRAGQ